MLRISAPLLALILGALPAAAQQTPAGQWASETGDYFYYGAAASDGTYVYLIAGYQPYAGNPSGDPYRATRRYDPASNGYTTLGDLPESCYLNAGGYYSLNGEGYLYSFGNGYWGSGAIYRMSIATGSWSTVGNLTGARYGAMSAQLGTKFFIAGGLLNGTYTNACDEFDPATNQSTGRASMPGNSYMGCMAAVPALDKAYVIGGYNNGYVNANYEFTPPSGTSTSGSWATRAAMVDQNNTAAPRGEYPAAFSLQNRVYVAGGYSNNGATLTLFEYLPTANTWAQRANMAYQRYYTAAATVNGKGYVFGGGNYPTTAEEYTPPQFGSAPNIPSAVVQAGPTAASSLQAQSNASIPDGWTNSQIAFSAGVTDPDSGQQVRLRVQVKPQSALWTSGQVVSLASPLGAQGPHAITYTIPAGGGYDWRWRVEDAFANSYPAAANTWIEAFGSEAAPNTNSPDFRSDQLAPADPIALAPSNIDIQVPDPAVGSVTLYWTESSDNGPVSAISYELQVATDGGFNNVEQQFFSPAGTSNYFVTLSVSRYDKFWRIRARDVGGNLSNWSAPLTFRVTYDDRVNHGAGDSGKTCGFGAAAATPMLPLVLAGLALIAFGRKRIGG